MEETELERKQRERAEAQASGGDAGEGSTGEGDAGAGEGSTGGESGEGGESRTEHEGDPPGEGNGEQAVPAIVLPGEGKLSLSIGGEAPDKATVKLRGGSIPVPAGQMKKGEVLNLMVKVQIAEVHVVDKINNATGEITETERRHVAKIKAVEKIPAG